jgi:hypothetical protein
MLYFLCSVQASGAQPRGNIAPSYQRSIRVASSTDILTGVSAAAAPFQLQQLTPALLRLVETCDPALLNNASPAAQDLEPCSLICTAFCSISSGNQHTTF